MSNPSQQQPGPGQQQRQPVNYPSPTSYPSPSLSSAQGYNYPPPGSQPAAEPYRASPTGSNGSLSLPSMRSLDHQQQQQHNMSGSPLPPPVAQMGGPYYQHHPGQGLPHPYANVTSDPNGQNMRYALPVTDNRVMSGGRHKKEIKRRTKTGCLTCRKRRIKCDEAHPQCRNCQKSKRECLGYDPIFKQQPGPTAIQPAPSSAPSQNPVAAPASNPYGNQPMMGSYSGLPSMNYDPSLSAGVSSHSPSSQTYDYSNAIDPALEASAPVALQYTVPGMPDIKHTHMGDFASASPDSSAAGSPHIRGGGPPYAASWDPSIASAEDVAYTLPAKRSIQDLLAQGGDAPTPMPDSDISQNPQKIDEAKHLYYSIYAPGLENFLESKWFAHKGAQKILGDKSMLQHFGVLLQRFAETTSQDNAEIAYTSAYEARVVWALANMVRMGDVKGSGGLVPAQDDPVEAGHRLAVFETLLTGAVVAHNPLTQPVPGSTDHHRLRELEFWFTLGNFICLPYDQDGSAKVIDDNLSALRSLLDGRENRDVLYSIAVVRSIGQRVSDYTETDAPLHFDESDNRSKLSVAKKFINDEGEGAGTTNVIRRLCELSARSWETPDTTSS